MCLYSAEASPQRQAKVGDKLVLREVHSSIAGLFEAGGHGLLVCIACGTTLVLSNIPKRVRRKLCLDKTEVVITGERQVGGHQRHVDIVQLARDSRRSFTFSQLGLDCTLAEVRVLGKTDPLENNLPTLAEAIRAIRPQIIMSPNSIEVIPAEALMSPPAHHSDFAGRRRELALSER